MSAQTGEEEDQRIVGACTQTSLRSHSKRPTVTGVASNLAMSFPEPMTESRHNEVFEPR